MKKFFTSLAIFLAIYTHILIASDEQEELEIVFQINCDFIKKITKYGEEVLPKIEGRGNLVFRMSTRSDGLAAVIPPFPNDPTLFSLEERDQPRVREVTGFDGSRHFIFPSPSIHFNYNQHLVIHKDGTAVRTYIAYDAGLGSGLVVESEIGTCEVSH